MSLFLWVPGDPGAPTAAVVRAMSAALRVHPAQQAAAWHLLGLGLGILDHDPCGATLDLEPARLGGRHLWMAGEAFDGGGFVDVKDVDESRLPSFRARLLDAIVARGLDGVRSLDGEYVIVVWDADARTLTVVNDRCGGLPTFWSRTSTGVAIAGGVRGVLMAPGVGADPDVEALRESVTFGGFRLRDRTNIAGVKMLPGGAVLTVHDGRVEIRRYWRYGDIAPRQEARLRHPSTGAQGAPSEVEGQGYGGQASQAHLLEEAGALWRRAIARRLGGCDRPGQTLSGGLDSRAILAEAPRQAKSWVAVTYGPPTSDDVRIAEQAARAAGVRWRRVDPYERDWLERRSRHIQATDGLIALGDLMHVDSIDVQAAELHVQVSGYIGDVVCGPSYTDIERVDDLYRTLPYYGTGLGLTGDEAHERLLQIVEDLGGAHVRWAILENKMPQSTNLWTAAWRPWIRVRKPFVDYELADFWLALPLRLRREGRLYERFLVSRYPRLFRRIPYQKTGVPVLTPWWKHQATRIARFARRRGAAALGLPAPRRLYQDDRGHLSADQRRALEETILGSGSLCSDVLGRERVAGVLRAWLDRGDAPDQVIGALYVWERYFRDLAGHLRRARG